jgi:nucleoside-diphosphate-sugar epimerase
MFTIFGSSGFIGSHLAEFLKAIGEDIYLASREPRDIPPNKNLGTVIYCIGMTANYREKPFETIDAHVNCLAYILKNYHFSSLLYLSSTRVYQGSNCSNEDQSLSVNSNNPGDIYNVSKILGESLCLNCTDKTIRIARLSNVFGCGMSPENFLFDISQCAALNKQINLRTSLESEKDYISIHDAVRALYKIATQGQHTLYNVASGKNKKNQDIIDIISSNIEFNLSVEHNAPTHSFPEIDIRRLTTEFSFSPAPFRESYENFLLNNIT